VAILKIKKDNVTLLQSNYKMKKPGQLRPDFLSHTPLVLGKEINITMPNGDKRQARFAIVDLNTIIASHNENNFQSSAGYPINDDGSNINDRNYLDDANAQKLVQDYARTLDPERLITTSRTPSGTPIITKDGIVVSGNNRTMSAKIAVKKYPEKYKEYLDFLHEEIAAFGINYSKLNTLKHPFLVRIDYEFPEYNTEELARYNKDTKKSERPIDKAIKLSHILRNNPGIFGRIAEIVGKYETFSEFYAVSNDTNRFAKVLIESGILTEQELPAFYESGQFTEQGKDFIEQMLGAMVLNRDSLLASNLPGVRQYRQTLITSLPVLIANAKLQKGNLNEPLNQAIIFLYQRAKSKSTLFDILNQTTMFEKVEYNRKAVILSCLLEAGRNTFKQSIEKYNDAIKAEEAGSLFGDKKDPDEIFKLVIESKISKEQISIIDRSKLVVDHAVKQEIKPESKTSGFPIEGIKQKAQELSAKIDAVIEKYSKNKSSNDELNLSVGEQILFDPNAHTMIVAEITEIRDKSVKINYALEPVSVYSRGNKYPVFTHTTFIPKSVIEFDKTFPSDFPSLTLKKWYAKKGWLDAKKFNIKKYYYDGDKKVFV